MKKVIAIILSLMFVVSAFSGCGNSGKDNVYIGEGKMTVLRSMISTNGFIADEIFGANHLPVDMSKTITQDGCTFAPVVSDRIKSYAELETLLKSVYVEDVVNKLLNEPKKYVEIDGVLYFDLQYALSETETKYDWSEFEVEFDKTNEDGSQNFEVSLKKTNGWKTKIDITAVETDGMPRLCDFYN